jgi:hypothetical protein
LTCKQQESWVRQQLADREPVGGREWQPSDEESLGFEWEIVEEPAGDRYLLLYSEDWGDPSAVARFMQSFLMRFRPDRRLSLTFAYGFGKSRINETGGGAIFVSAQSIVRHDTEDWVTQMIRGRDEQAAAKAAMN